MNQNPPATKSQVETRPALARQSRRHISPSPLALTVGPNGSSMPVASTMMSVSDRAAGDAVHVLTRCEGDTARLLPGERNMDERYDDEDELPGWWILWAPLVGIALIALAMILLFAS